MPGSKKGEVTLIAVTLLILNRFSKNLLLSDSPVNLQKSTINRPHHTSYALLHYFLSGALMSENEKQLQTNVVINDKLQGTVVTNLPCGGIVNDQIKKGLLLNPPVKNF